MPWVLRNQTPLRLRIERAEGRFDLAPLQQVRLHDDPASWGAGAAQARTERVLTWQHAPVRSSRERYAAWLVALGWVTTAALVVCVVLERWPLAALATGVLVAVVWSVGRLVAGDDTDALEFLSEVIVRTAQALLLLIVLVVGLALPGAALVFGTEVAQLLDIVGWDVTAHHEAQQLLAARGIQFVLIGVLTLLPALLYFQFDREKVETLLDRWLHHIFRFDPTLRTLDDVDARYGRRLEEFYGTSVSTASGDARQRSRSRSPVVLATLLLGMGWVLVLVNTDSASTFTTLGRLPDTTRLFEVARTPVSFAFLGAYLYALQVVLRGYVRGDLRPKTYAAISVRVVISMVLAWVLAGILTGVADAGLLGTAFLAGVVPDTVLRYLRDVVTGGWRLVHGRLRGGSVDELDDRWPLTDLVGIDLYERTRLAEEGITNVQALAHSDVVDLTLSTRIPFERVVNWVDQAVLYEHVRGSDRSELRGYGVLTATDLVRAAKVAPDVVGHLLGEGRLRAVLAAMEHADWLPGLIAWRGADVDRRSEQLVFPRPVEVVLTGTPSQRTTTVEGTVRSAAGGAAPAAVAGGR